MQRVNAKLDLMQMKYTILHKKRLLRRAQVISLDNICMLDGLWTSTSQFSGCGWVWKDSLGKIQLIGTRHITRHETALHFEVEALHWAMGSMLQHTSCQNFRTYCKDLIAVIKNFIPSQVLQLNWTRYKHYRYVSWTSRFLIF